jgi:hypothetical protein
MTQVGCNGKSSAISVHDSSEGAEEWVHKSWLSNFSEPASSFMHSLTVSFHPSITSKYDLNKCKIVAALLLLQLSLTLLSSLSFEFAPGYSGANF